jgi:hypothetical protein
LIGRSFSFQLLTAVSQMDVDELFDVIEKAQGMGIVVPSSEGPGRPFTFSHELVRQTLLAGISAPRQERLHAGVADAIERLYPGAVNERAGEIADHLIKAGSFTDDRKLVLWLTLAGKGALEAAHLRKRGAFSGPPYRIKVRLKQENGLTCWRALRSPSEVLNDGMRHLPISVRRSKFSSISMIGRRSARALPS